MSQSRNHLRLTKEGCEATGKQDATLWWLTSPATPAILRGVGCAVGGSTLLGGSGAGRTTPDAPCDCILLCSEMYSLINVAMNICSCISRNLCLYHTRFSDSSVLSGFSNTTDPPGNQRRRAVRSVFSKHILSPSRRYAPTDRAPSSLFCTDVAQQDSPASHQ